MGVPKMQDVSGEVNALRLKLEAMNYLEGLDSLDQNSAPLAKRLLDDVVHMTERYRSLKMQEATKGYELEGEKKKVELLTQENGRLLKENNELHLSRMKDAESERAKERAEWLSQRRIDDELAELKFWKSQAMVRIESLEKERSKMQKELQQQLAGNTHMTISDPLVSEPAEGSKTRLPKTRLPDAGVVDLIRLSDERAAMSSEQIAFLQAQQAELSDLLAVAQDNAHAREDEIKRLTRLLEGGRDLDDLSAAYQKKATEELLASLKHQVDFMTKELAAFDEVSKRKEEAEQRLGQAEARVVSLNERVAEQQNDAEKFAKETFEVYALLNFNSEEPQAPDDESAGLFERARTVQGRLLERAQAVRTEMMSRNEEIERLKKGSQKQQEQVKELKRKLGGHEKEKQAAGEENARLKEEIAATRRELVSTKNDLASKRVRIQKLEQEGKKQKDALAELESELQGARKSLEASRKELDALQRSSGKKKSGEGKTGEQENALCKKVEGLEREVRELKEQRQSAAGLEKMHSQIESLRGEIAREDEVLARLSKITDDEDVVSRLERELAAQVPLLHEFQSRLLDAEEKTRLLQSENERLVAKTQSALAEAQGDQLRELQAILHKVQEELRQKEAAEDLDGNGQHGLAASESGVQEAGAEVSLQEGQEVPRDEATLSGVSGGLESPELERELFKAREQVRTLQSERDSLAATVEGLRVRVSELEKEVASSHDPVEPHQKGVRTGSEGEAGDPQAVIKRLRFELSEREADLACLQEDYEVQAKKMQDTMDELNRRVLALEQTNASLVAQREKAEASLDEAMSHSKEVQAECERLRKAEKSLEERVARAEEQQPAASKELQESRSEALKLKRQLAELDLGIGTKALQGDELQRQCIVLRQSLQAAKQREEALQAKLQDATSERDQERSSSARMREELLEARHQLDVAEKDEEQLKTLITQLDATREDLVTKLRASLAAERVASKHVSELEDEKSVLKRELDRTSNEVAQLRQVIEALDRDRDHMQGEVDVRAEEISRLVQETAAAQGQVADLRLQLDTAEHRLANALGRATQAEEEALRSQEHLKRQTEAVAALQEECDIKASELHSVADEVAGLTREHQHLNGELVQVAEERNALQDELERVARKLDHAEQLVRAKDKEHADLLTSLQQLGEENQRLSTGLQQAQHEVQHLQLQIASAEETMNAMQDHIKTIEEESQQQIADLQAYERQCDSLSRSLAQQAEILEELQADKAGLIAQLTTAKQVNVELDHSRSYLQREVAAAEARIHSLQARLQDDDNEKESLLARCQQEHGRVRELEQLLARVRAQEHMLEVTAQDKGQRTSMLQERIHILDGQVSALQQEVDTLQAFKEAQDAEIEKLRKLARDSDKDAKSERERPNTADARRQTGETQREMSRLRESHHKLQEEVAALTHEKESMLGLLSKLDSERDELRRQLQSGAGSAHELEGLRKRCADVEKQLQDSEARRKSLENDFEALVSSVEGFPGGEGSRKEGDSVERRLADVLSENQRLRESLAAAMAACSSTEADLQRIRQEYIAITEVLHSRT